MHEEFSAVYRLQVHMPREHRVYFDDDASPDQLRNRMEAAPTNLLEFFRYNAQHADGRQYPEFPNVSSTGIRSGGLASRGNRAHVPVQQGERFYLNRPANVL
jgi:hypothetical protein